MLVAGFGGGDGGAFEKLPVSGMGGSTLAALSTGGGSSALLRSRLHSLEAKTAGWDDGCTERRAGLLGSLPLRAREFAACVASRVELALPYLLYESLL